MSRSITSPRRLRDATADMSQGERDLWAKAKKVALADYQGRALYFKGEYYFDDPDELVRDAGGAWPEMVFGTIETPIALYALGIVYDLEQSDAAYDDYEVPDEGVTEIEEFCDRWNARYADRSYCPDFETGITNDDEAGGQA